MCSVLFAIDKIATRDFLDRTVSGLNKLEHEVFYTVYPKEVLKLYETHRVAAVIIDFDMGYDNVLMLVKELRASSVFLPILITYSNISDPNKLIDIVSAGNHVMTMRDPGIFDLHSFLKTARNTNDVFTEKHLLNAAIDLWKKPLVIFDRHNHKILFANKACKKLLDAPDTINVSEYCLPDILTTESRKNLQHDLELLYETGSLSGTTYIKTFARDELEVYIHSYICNGFIISLISDNVGIERNLHLLETQAKVLIERQG